MIAKFIYENLPQVQSFIAGVPERKEDLKAVEDFFDFLREKRFYPYENYKGNFYRVLNEYNMNQRLKMSLSELKKLENRFSNSILPNSTPCEYVDQAEWQTYNEEIDNKKFIGHGWYWREGDCKTKDIQGAGDYDSLEDNFLRVKTARVMVCDYELLKKDFQFISGKSNGEIDNWLLDQVAYISDGQVKRIMPGGDIYPDLELPTNPRDIFDESKKKFGIRYKGGGRAANFVVDDKFEIKKNEDLCKASYFNVKGIGTDRINDYQDKKLNGMLSLVDAYKEYAYQKLIQSIGDKEKYEGNSGFDTVQTYAIIDLGIKYKDGLENPATSFPGDIMALTVRQCTSRFVSSPLEFAFYSVVTLDFQKNNQYARDFIRSLSKYYVTSEQIPLTLLNQEGDHGEWNIQADATLSRFVDFSQFYVLPDSKLPNLWKTSEKGLLEGIMCCSKMWQTVIKDKDLMHRYLNTEDVNVANDMYSKELPGLIKRFGDIAGKTIKSKTSWSWFLEVDDSELFNFSMREGIREKGCITSCSGEPNYSPRKLHELIMSWISL